MLAPALQCLLHEVKHLVRAEPGSVTRDAFLLLDNAALSEAPRLRSVPCSIMQGRIAAEHDADQRYDGKASSIRRFVAIALDLGQYSSDARAG